MFENKNMKSLCLFFDFRKDEKLYGRSILYRAGLQFLVKRGDCLD